MFNQHFADIADRFLRKGTKVYLEGTLQTRKWTDQQGQERYTTEVVLPRFGEGQILKLSSDRTEDDDGAGSEREPRASAPRRTPAMAGAGAGGGAGWGVPPGGGDLDDEIPFAACRD